MKLKVRPGHLYNRQTQKYLVGDWVYHKDIAVCVHAVDPHGRYLILFQKSALSDPEYKYISNPVPIELSESTVDFILKSRKEDEVWSLVKEGDEWWFHSDCYNRRVEYVSDFQFCLRAIGVVRVYDFEKWQMEERVDRAMKIEVPNEWDAVLKMDINEKWREIQERNKEIVEERERKRERANREQREMVRKAKEAARKRKESG